MSPDFQKQFLKHLKRLGYPAKDQKCLVAFSGGVDSLVLAHLLHESGIGIGLAHVNYQLRGEDSDIDEKFCRQWARKKDLPFHFLRINGKAFKQIQTEARNVRYTWFDELCSDFEYEFIATAHHQSDTVETMLQNFFRGTGIEGLGGLPEKRNHIIRPLLFANKEEILEYAENEGLSWRKDVSNQESNYQRNWIRNQLLPLLEQRFPAVKDILSSRSADYREIAFLYQKGVASELNRLTKAGKFGMEISKSGLMKHQSASTLLFEWLKEAGFNREMVRQVYENMDAQVGKTFNSESHTVIIQRKSLVLVSRENEKTTSILIEKPGKFKHSFGTIVVKKVPAGKLSGKESENVIDLPIDSLELPLILRSWQKGDFFYPEGLNKESGKPARKKLSDFLTDQKLEPTERIGYPVLCAGDKILWIPGLRKDSRARRLADSDMYWRLSWKRS